MSEKKKQLQPGTTLVCRRRRFQRRLHHQSFFYHMIFSALDSIIPHSGGEALHPLPRTISCGIDEIDRA
jgi:hypothetical protein